MYKRTCITCNTEFKTNHPNYINCSPKCNRIYRVNQRYVRENNDWDRYYKHLLSKKQNHTLTVAQLISKTAEQDYKCALSGVELTCIHKRGTTILTNASIDRINAGKEYNYDNIQIVCRAINNFRSDMPVNEYIDWCMRVAFHGLQKQKETI